MSSRTARRLGSPFWRPHFDDRTTTSPQRRIGTSSASESRSVSEAPDPSKRNQAERIRPGSVIGTAKKETAGWRRSEATELRWSQVDFDAGVVRLEPGSTKNEDGRTFPFEVLPPLRSLLVEQHKRTTKLASSQSKLIPWVFHRQGQHVLDIRRAWKRACESAGLVGRRVHDLRRSAVRNLERAGVPRSIATKLVGHRTESIYRRYAVAAERDLSDGVRKLASFFSEKSERARKRHS